MNKEEIENKIYEFKENLELIKKCDKSYEEILKAQEIEEWRNK